MRLILGILIGIAITLGAFYVHDVNVPAASASSADPNQPAALSSRPIVNWDVLSATVHDQTAFIRTQWNKMFH